MITGHYNSSTYFYQNGITTFNVKELIKILKDELQGCRTLDEVNNMLIEADYNTVTINNMLHSDNKEDILLAFEIIFSVLESNNIFLRDEDK